MNVVEIAQQAVQHAENPVWEAPVLFDITTGADIPASLLSPPFAEFAKALAEATETPEAMATLIVLGTIALILSRKFRVVINSGYSESLNLYLFITMEPGNRKSGVFKAALAPIVKWEKEQKKILQPVINEAISERQTIQAMIDKLRKNAKKENASKTKADIKELEEQMPTIPVAPQLFLTDATPESFKSKLVKHHGYMGALSDEGGIVDVIAGLYTGGKANIDIFLKGIEGGQVRVVRKDEDVSLKPYLTFVLVVQQAVLTAMAEQKSFGGRGLLERFLYCIPQSYLGYRSHDKNPVPDKVRKSYEQAITNLLNIPDKIEDDEVIQRELYSDNNALNCWKDFRNNVEVMMQPNGSLHHCTGWASKLPGFVFRIAGNLYLSKHHTNGEHQGKIDTSSMLSAINIGNKLIEHAAIAFHTMVCDKKTRDARALWQWVLEQGKPSLTRSEITYGVKNRATGKAETLEVLITELNDRNLIREKIINTGGRPATVYELNPKVLEVTQNYNTK